MAIAIVEPSPLPEIRVGVDLERMNDEAIGVLAKDERVFQRSGELVHVVRIPESAPRARIRRQPGTPTIRALPLPLLRERLSVGARWLRYAKGKGSAPEVKAVLPPIDVCAGIIARGEWGGIRHLSQVVTAPMLLPDGSVLQVPGHHAPSGLLYWPSARFADVDDAPTRDDAIRARDVILEVVCDFPFAKPEHRSAWLAGVLTMLARSAIDGPCPLFAVDANTRGAGKSRLVDSAVRLVHGHDAARMSQPDDDDEMRKRITTLVLEGDAAVLLDNVARPLQYPSFDAMLTSTTWKDRQLGSNSSISAPNLGVWWTNGNNLDLGGDLSRRTLHMRIESPLENPEERDGFRHPNLLAWIAQERHRLVPVALTCLLAFTRAGSPRSGVRPWGSFEAWSELVAACVAWLDLPDPMLARATVDPSLDEGKTQLAIVLDGLARLSPDKRPLSVRAILDALYPSGDPRDREPDGFDALRDALEAAARAPRPGQRPDSARVGRWLRKHKGRVVGGRRLVQGSDEHAKIATWVVEA